MTTATKRLREPALDEFIALKKWSDANNIDASAIRRAMRATPPRLTPEQGAFKVGGVYVMHPDTDPAIIAKALGDTRTRTARGEGRKLWVYVDPAECGSTAARARIVKAITALPHVRSAVFYSDVAAARKAEKGKQQHSPAAKADTDTAIQMMNAQRGSKTIAKDDPRRVPAPTPAQAKQPRSRTVSRTTRTPTQGATANA